MRALIAGAFILISFVFLPLHGPSTALADDACRCKGCGGAGLARLAARHASKRAAPRLCFGK